MTAIDLQIISGSYDCSESLDTTLAINGWDTDGDRVGERSGNRDDIGVIFVGVTIPPGAIITTAYLQGYHNWVGDGNPPIIIKGFDENDPLPFTSTTRPSQRAKIATTVSATCPNGVGGYVSFAEMNTIVQALIQRPGWVSGNRMGFSIEESSSPVDYRSQFGDYFYDVAKVFKFHADYTTTKHLTILGVG